MDQYDGRSQQENSIQGYPRAGWNPDSPWTLKFVDALVWNVFNVCIVDLVFRWEFNAEFALFTESLMPTAEVCLREFSGLTYRQFCQPDSNFTYFVYSFECPPPFPWYCFGQPSCVEDTCEPSLSVFLACMQLCFFYLFYIVTCTSYVRYTSIYIVTSHVTCF